MRSYLGVTRGLHAVVRGEMDEGWKREEGASERRGEER